MQAIPSLVVVREGGGVVVGMIHVEDIERVMNAIEEMCEAANAPADEALGERARAEGICPDCLVTIAVATNDTPDEAVSFIVGVIVGATLINNKVNT
jgi:hypothetical protein